MFRESFFFFGESFRESLIKLNSKRGHTFFFDRYDRISTYGIYSMIISLYHQVKTPIGFGVDRVQTPNLLFDNKRLYQSRGHT